jgi:hypothetical protein
MRRANSQTNLKRSNSQVNLRRSNSRQNLAPQRVRLNRNNFRQNAQQRARSLSRTNSRQNLSVNNRLGNNRANVPAGRRRNPRFGTSNQINGRATGILRGRIMKKRNNNKIGKNVAQRVAPGGRGGGGRALKRWSI